ncbi:hypothetical protein, variant 4 [Aphanomyces invadans]|uniref:Polycystin cation channel PKD1/PKD2 domain-containing protein n=1 Tax=Aphanomyces invadans TaxID=157072 RepID=A0A024TDE7_9STRA|nr:hypothetical protein, variant 4 [Aphanomyces invadans]XP_008879151.1 hypothetical protein, variant 3 [Aphanomyces invadans]ETV92184.1 hypothetical protein, variant 3 [Aphanomyces invadans]ETV92185.1 hypothetical protein, variant 4 [Aphanomyces invadans]|eukprot:XP_008879146.1 hypothetical protein, variant 4 [Aphanomyces invadans]
MRSEEEELLEPLVDPSPPSPQMGKDRSGNPLAHGVHLSPWERYWHHGRIPWKVILHALLMFCGTLQIMLYDNQNSAYVRASYRNWAYFFLPNGGMSTSTRSMDATPLEESIFTVNDTLNAVAHVRDAYFSIKDVSVATYEYHYAAPTIVQPMLMSVTQYKNKTIGPPQHYNITPTSLGPFDDLDTTETAMVFLHSLVTIEFSFPLRDIDYGPFYVDCFDWTVRLTLAMHENSHFRLRVDECSLDVCSVKNVWATLRGRFVWMNVLVAVFAGIYLVVILRSVVRAVKRLARRPKHDPVPATLRDLNGHYCLIGATLVLVEFNALWNISSVVVHVPLRFDHRFIQALGPLLLWSTFVGWSDSSYVHAAFPVVASRLLPGGGVARLFWQACVTLFAILNGDVILDTFASLHADFPFVGAAYLYSFIALFIYVVLNIFIAIVEEAFFATRSHSRALDTLAQSIFPSPSHPTERDHDMTAPDDAACALR